MFTRLNRQIKRLVIRQQRNRPIVRISDTTLRDGCQTPGVRLSPTRKAEIAAALAATGIHSIDCGFPAAGEHDMAGVREITKRVKGPVFSVHARTLNADIDRAAEALAGVSPLKRAVTIFIGISPLHRDHKHGMSKTQVIDAVTKSVEYASSMFEVISFGPEDASRTEPEFLHEVYKHAIAAGCVSVGYTDTVGVQSPEKVYDALRRLQDEVPNINDSMIGVHFHNDLGLATANALAAVRAGAHVVQGTINGIGERAGNTAIEEVVLALHLHRDEYKRRCAVDLSALAALSKLVADRTGFPIAPNKAVVGENLFRTETGVHQDGMMKHTATYMPFPPELIGADPVKYTLGPNSGRKAVRAELEAQGLPTSDEYTQQVLDYLKTGEFNAEEHEEIRTFLERLQPHLNRNDAEQRA